MASDTLLAAEPPATPPGEPAPAFPPRHHPSLDRYRPLNVASAILIVGGVIATALVLVQNTWLLSNELPAEGVSPGPLLIVVAGGVAVVLGLAIHVARAIVVREPLWEGRYRGPSVVALLLLSVIAANAASLSVARDVLALTQGDAPSTLGSLVLLTITQASLLAVAGLFVAAPRALAGLRFIPERRLLSSIGLGVVVAVPAWIGAQLLAVLTSWLLEPSGLRPQEGVAESAISLVDPVVLIVALCVVAPIAEEIFFRGVVLNAWLREFGRGRAIVGSAALFAVLHGSIFLIVPIFALGLGLALVYVRTSSLPAAIAMHATFNGITLLLGLLVRFDVVQLPR